MMAVGVLIPPLLYGATGLAVAGLLGWRSARLFDVLLAGYLALHLPFLAVSAATDRGWIAFGCSLALAAAAIACAVARRSWREAALASTRAIDPLDAILLLAVAAFVGWPFLGPAPGAPWGTINRDLIDSYLGGEAVFNHPELAHLYKELIHGATNYGQYTAAGLSFALSGHPPQLLADYWHLQFLFALMALGIATLAREGLGLGRWWAAATGLLAGTSSLLTMTVYNGHIGSTMFLPLGIAVIRMGWAADGIPPRARAAIGGGAGVMLCATYLYPAVLLVGGALAWMAVRVAALGWMPGPVRRAGALRLILFMVLAGVLALVVLHPLFAGYRAAADLKYRAWAMALRPEMIGVVTGLDPSGLAWSDRVMEALAPLWCGTALLGLLASLAIVGVIGSRRREMAPCLAGLLAIAGAMAVAVAVVVHDSYYFYKVVYIGCPFALLAAGAGVAVMARRCPWRIGVPLALLALAALALPNCLSTARNARMMLRAPFNAAVAGVEEAIPVVKELESRGRSVEGATTGNDLATVLEYYARREGLRIAIDRWTYSEHFKQAIKVAFTDAAKQSKPRKSSTVPVSSEELQLIPRHFPEVLVFDDCEAMTQWSNDIWKLVDRSMVPRIAGFGFFSQVSRFPFALNDQPFRWMRDILAFKVDRWPETHRFLSFYAQAGYGSTSGLFDLAVSCNGHEILRRTVGSVGDWLEAEIPASALAPVTTLEFSGTPRPGPPLQRREFIDMRALVAAIRVAPAGAPRWTPGQLALFNGPDDVARLDPAHGAMLGPGWGPREAMRGRPLHWLTAHPATVVLAAGRPAGGVLRLAGQRGPGVGEAGPALEVRSSQGWSRGVAIRAGEIVIPLADPPAEGWETLSLQLRHPDRTVPAADGRRLVFCLDRLELQP